MKGNSTTTFFSCKNINWNKSGSGAEFSLIFANKENFSESPASSVRLILLQYGNPRGRPPVAWIDSNPIFSREPSSDKPVSSGVEPTTSNVCEASAGYTNTGKRHPREWCNWSAIEKSISFETESIFWDWMFTYFNSPHFSLITSGCDDVASHQGRTPPQRFLNHFSCDLFPRKRLEQIAAFSSELEHQCFLVFRFAKSKKFVATRNKHFDTAKQRITFPCGSPSFPGTDTRNLTAPAKHPPATECGLPKSCTKLTRKFSLALLMSRRWRHQGSDSDCSDFVTWLNPLEQPHRKFAFHNEAGTCRFSGRVAGADDGKVLINLISWWLFYGFKNSRVKLVNVKKVILLWWCRFITAQLPTRLNSV